MHVCVRVMQGCMVSQGLLDGWMLGFRIWWPGSHPLIPLDVVFGQIDPLKPLLVNCHTTSDTFMLLPRCDSDRDIKVWFLWY